MTRRSRLLLTCTVAVVLGAGAAGSATAATPTAHPVTTSVRAQALPPYSTWIADVGAVTAQAASYLAHRLPDTSHRAAVVLDIDNTALETAYSFGLQTPATAPVLDLARQAKAAGAAIFFVTARPELLRAATQANLRQVSYPVDGLYLRPWFDSRPDQAIKTEARTAIENRGYTIVANIGNNTSDLQGGHAERTFKLPDYDQQLP